MGKVESKIPAPATLDSSSLADWVESAMLIEERKYMSKSSMRQRLKGALSIESEEAEVEIELLLSEVSRRDKIAPQVYPFSESPTGLSRKEIPDLAVYEFLLWLSVSPRYKWEDRYREIDEHFDKLVKQALIRYLGGNARGVRFAFPSSDGRPAGFPEAVSWLAGLLNLATGKAIPRPRVKDGGVDVVVWCPFRDGRTGFVVILCQCTVELNWPPKAKDIVIGNWCGLIDFGLHPLTVLGVPFAVPRTFEKWDELRRTVNIVLDRMRLCELIQAESIENLEEIRRWAEAERKLLSVDSGS
jgi:hypothetical protein